MTTQPRLWGHADTATVQPGLFDGLPVVSDVACQECGRLLVETESGYLCCVMGHGRLNLAFVEDERSGLWFDDTLEG